MNTLAAVARVSLPLVRIVRRITQAMPATTHCSTRQWYNSDDRAETKMIVAGIEMTKTTPLPAPNTPSMPSLSASAPKTSLAPSLANAFSLVIATLAASKIPWPSGVWNTARPMSNCSPIPHATTRHDTCRRFDDIAQARPKNETTPSKLINRSVMRRRDASGPLGQAQAASQTASSFQL